MGPFPLRIGTLNIANTSYRWRERRGLVVSQLAELRPDVIGLQELRRRPSQARWITRRVNELLSDGPPYLCHFSAKAGLWGLWEGIALLTRLPVVARGSLDLCGQNRVANWVRVGLAGGSVIEVHNVHLASHDRVLRDRQARLILDHTTGRGETPTLVVGDLNAGPLSSTLALLGERFRSAHSLAHGDEPAQTWPTPLRAGGGRGSVIDHVLVDRHLEVVDAWLTFDRASPGDPTLFPSDHFGIVAEVRGRAS